MTISLLRRIWQRIIPDNTGAVPRQRLTGFEALEPRMVMSGFVAHFAPDYFSPPPGYYSQMEPTGAEIARPTQAQAYGAYADYNSFGRGTVDPSLIALFDHPTLGGRGNDSWQVGTPYGSIFESLGPYLSPLASAETTSEANYDLDGDAVLEKVEIINVPLTPDMPIGYISISPLAVDRIFGVTSSISFNSLAPMTTMSTMSSSFRSLTDRDYNPVSSGGAVEKHFDAHEYAALSHGSGSDASLALAARLAAAERGTLSAAANAALTNQATAVNSIVVQNADGSTANGSANAAANGSGDQEQNGIWELTEGERLKLKRKLAADLGSEEETELDAATASESYDASDAQVAYDPTRPFDVAMTPDARLRLEAAASAADDGLIEILASDVTTLVASSDVVDQAAANRQLVMEPSVATYQAFETIVAGDAQAATDVVADAARLAGAVAMAGQPVVQAE